MRVFSYNCHGPFICCFKPSHPRHCLTSPPRSGGAEHSSSIPASISVVLEEKLFDEKVVDEQTREDEGKVEVFLKSSLKKPVGSGSNKVDKGNVKWMDLLGKELEELREFEPSESGEEDSDSKPACSCAIQ